eukprot:TRINITY_DN2593_c0_g2_i2.p1 TRINITY_DN2593_c0_g2~~TRINITY_DN2593_c0_g2_i2.p1  ORF type:complete len:195 (+),score=25.28 TRINITY_DN2593_c0_g2_i2:109-693(+)
MIFLGGTNDLGGGLHTYERHNDLDDSDEFAAKVADAVFAALKQLYVTAKENNAHCVCLSIFEHGGDDPQKKTVYSYINRARALIAEKQKDYCSNPENNASFFDLGKEFPYFGIDEESRKELWGDRIHPVSENGEDRKKRFIFKSSQRLLNEKQSQKGYEQIASLILKHFRSTVLPLLKIAEVEKKEDDEKNAQK